MENKIEWNNILQLHQLQENELFYLANKLRSKHIYFKNKIMNVRLGTQLFSDSVADALTFCQKLNLPSFNNSSPTAHFLKLFNDVFDILDSKTHGRYGYKRAMNNYNYQQCIAKLNEAKQFIFNLNADIPNRNQIITKTNVLKTPRYTGFLGFCVYDESAKSLFKDLVLNPCTELCYLPLHKICQDHIVFSIIRSHGGFSDNATARQFESIYKKSCTNTFTVATNSQKKPP